MKSITFITSNIYKVKQVSHYLDFSIDHIALELPEIQSLDLKEIIEHKAKEAYAQIQKPVLVDDVCLQFNALGKLPGPFIKWFLQELGTEGLCRLLDNYKDRSAVAIVTFGLYDGRKLIIFDGLKEGTISKHPKGDKSFGWNPIFIPKGSDKTWGEMDLDEQKHTSARGIALGKLEKYLES